MANKEFIVNSDMSVPGDFKVIDDAVFTYVGSPDGALGGFSRDGIVWQSTKIPYSASWKNPVYGNNIFATVAYGGSDSLYSVDGINWLAYPMGASASWQELAYGNGIFVTVAYGTSTAKYSTDGINWITSTLPLNAAWDRVVYGNNKFIAFSRISYQAATSTNGIVWTQSSSPANYFSDVTFGNNKFVMILSNTGAVRSSTDGITWTGGTGFDNLLQQIEYNNGIFLIYVTGGNLNSSTDAITWNSYTLPMGYGSWNLSSGNGLFILTNGTITTSAISTNGITWTLGTQTNTAYTAAAAGRISYNASNLIYNNYGLTSNIKTQLDNKIDKGYPVVVDLKASSIVLQENIFVGAAGLTSSAYSTNGINWESGTLPISAGWSSSVYGNGIFVMISFDSTAAASSTDGVTWSLRTMPVVDSWFGLSYGNGVFVASSQYGLNAASSTDGLTWSLRTMPSNFINWQSIRYGNGIFVALSYNGSNFATTTNGIAWTLRTVPNGTWTDLSYGNGVFVSVANFDAAVITSTNGISWTASTMPSLSEWSSISYGNGIFVATAGLIGEAASSTNGITWTLRTMPTQDYWNSIIYGDEKFIAKADTGTEFIYAYSTDSVTWTLFTVTGTLSNFSPLSSAPFNNSISPKYIQGSLVGPITNSTYTVQEYDKYIVFSPTATSTITLPRAASYPNREITIKNTTAFAVNSASANVRPLTTNTAGTAILVATAGKFAKLISNGDIWTVVKSN